MDLQQIWTRRKFLRTAAVTGGGAALISPLAAWITDEIDPAVAKIVAGSIGIDTHNHVDVPYKKQDFMSQQFNLAEQLKKSGLSAICMTFQVDRPALSNDGEALERFTNSLDEMDIILTDNRMKRALNFLDLKKAHHDKKPLVIQSVEGGHFLEGKIERLQIAYQRGVRHLGLLHDNQSVVPLGDIYTDPAKFGGLTEFGTTVVKECNRLGILVDLAHCSNDAIDGALKASSKPVIISHTGLNTQLGQNANMARMMRPRLISKEQAKIVADAGGVIGVWTHLADSPLEYAQNIRALVDVVGIDHVCIGTDTKLTGNNDRPGGPQSEQGQKPGDQKPRGGDGGKRPEGPNQGFRSEGTNKNWPEQKYGFYYTVVDAMLKAGFNADEIGKIGGGNYCRVFDAATKNR
jgi:microsomal dipeptidase-like Zn-dependent dipeptidase